jgi:XRE family aerobic/anaerobic benzoate catabolism transcriptional regulator
MSDDPKCLTAIIYLQYIAASNPQMLQIIPMPASLPQRPTGPSPADPDERAFLAALGRQVRESRERRGLARKAMSQSAGVSERYLAQLEAGEGNASVLLLRSVARALETPLTELIDPRESSVEKRLIRRFLDRLPAHRLEDAMFRLMRDYGEEAATRRKRIALVGLRGAGKTTLGSALAAELDTPFVELDREIEREAGVSLTEIFLLYGQAGYRRIERRCLERLLAATSGMVITVGGGIVSEPDAYNLLLQHCFTVWVKASPDEHMARVVAQGDLRPMQGHSEAMADLKRILDAREPLYRKADAMLDTAGETPQQSLVKLRRTVTV